MSFPGCCLSRATSRRRRPRPACVAHDALKRHGEDDLRQRLPELGEPDLLRGDRALLDGLPVEHRFVEPPSAEMHTDLLHLACRTRTAPRLAPSSRSPRRCRRCNRPATRSSSRSASASLPSFGCLDAPVDILADHDRHRPLLRTPEDQTRWSSRPRRHRPTPSPALLGDRQDRVDGVGVHVPDDVAAPVGREVAEGQLLRGGVAAGTGADALRRGRGCRSTAMRRLAPPGRRCGPVQAVHRRADREAARVGQRMRRSGRPPGHRRASRSARAPSLPSGSPRRARRRGLRRRRSPVSS